MANVTYNGTAGTPGTNGVTPGAPGTAGGPGGTATATVPANTNTTNTATASGGAGGTGGSGGGGAGIGGAAGAGGAGGAASATSATTASAASTTSYATATGGTGGGAGNPGNYGTATTGPGANGGVGGTATAAATDTNAGGAARATARATGGTGGRGTGPGGVAGAGGIASGVTANASSGSGGYALAAVYQTGGDGGRGYAGANGGAGASSSLNNAATGSSTGYLRLVQTASGGTGGYSSGGAGGAGGAASATTSLTNTTANTLAGTNTATGGAGGGAVGGGTAGKGGTASTTTTLSGIHAVYATAYATGGTAGGGMGGATGGAASGSASAVSTTTGSDYVRATITVAGGGGAAVYSDSGNGGAGGAASAVTASVTAATATGGTATATARGTGGAGGRAAGAGNVGGAGGAATLATASAVSGAGGATAQVSQTGGAGGYGGTGAAGGAGASSTLTNAATGSTTGALRLSQTATGGAGGDSRTAAGGAAGTASSSLTLNNTVASGVYVVSNATGGAGGDGGAGANAAAGAAAAATIALTGAQTVDARVYATGGAGGRGYAGSNGATGGSASGGATATVTSTDVNDFARAYTVHAGGAGGGVYSDYGNGGAGAAITSTGATATAAGAARAIARATGTGGTGGQANGAGKTGGAGGAVSGTTATATSGSGTTYARAYQTGGAGGYGGTGAAGGAGASSTLTNAVTGSTTGYLGLHQAATGGAGGDSQTAAGGAAGSASSSLTLSNTLAYRLYGVSNATGGAGGNGGAGANAAAGAAAAASIALTGAQTVDARANATGGAGGRGYGGSNGGAGGTATGGATATGTSTSASDFVRAYTFLTGGAGGAVYSGNANGGAGAAIASTGATATAAGAARAIARAAGTGGTGGYANGAGKTGGAGGAVSGTTATAASDSGNTYARAYQTGGTGGYGRAGAAGGAGASSTLTNAVSGSTTGYLQLRQAATGGAGGDSRTAAGGTAGGGTSSLTYTNTLASDLRAFSYATGGTGGDGGAGANAAAGAAAAATAALTGTRSIRATVNATGGAGGRGYAGSKGAAGGAATGGATATGTSTLSGDTVGAYTTLTGGAGGAVYNGNANGGAGAAIASTGATATAAGAARAIARATGTGGTGGHAYGAGKTGGAGGAVSGTTATATSGSGTTYARAYQTGGAGGYGSGGAAGGGGASSTLTNAVSGSTTGYLQLRQAATGGAGGDSRTAAGGTAGGGTSSLTYTNTLASDLRAFSYATGGTGGDGGAGANAAAGAAAAATAALTGTRSIRATVNATGGAGGRGYAGSKGAAGGAATGGATATGTSTLSGDTVGAYTTLTGGAGGGVFYSSNANGGAGAAITSTGATATAAGAARSIATATGTGGTGGYANGTGKTGGAGGAVSGTTATATSGSGNTYARAYQTGGAGGYGNGGAAGGGGASSTLTNAVSGSTTGYLGLSQRATGGAGGNSAGAGGSGGAAGAGTSSLTFTDTTSNYLRGFALGYGGAGGNGATPTAGGVGTASLTLTGASRTTALATAGGGAGGTGGAGAAGGAASATANATMTGTLSAETASATATATGGTGAGTTRGAANAIATSLTANGQLASATANATGDSGTTRSTASTRNGGIATGVDATASVNLGPDSVNVTAFSQADTVNIFGFGSTTYNAYAFATNLPDPGNVNAFLSANPNVNAVLGSGNASARIFSYALQGGFEDASLPGNHTLHSAISFTVDSTLISGHLVAGLLDNQLFSTGFQSASFNVVVGGATVVTQGFVAAAAAQSYFNDRVLDLGAVTPVSSLVVTFTLDLTTTANGRGFGESFFLGTTNGNTPPVNAVPGPQTLQAGTSEAIVGLNVSDADAGASDPFVVTVSDLTGLLSTKVTTGTSGQGTNTLTFNGTLAQVNAALATLSVLENNGGTDTLTIKSNDGKGGSDTDTVVLTTVGLPTLSIAADQTSKNEGNSGTTPFTFTVTRGGDTSGASAVNYAVLGGAAVDQFDFAGGTLPSGTANFAAGQTKQTITINVAGDTTIENNEDFTVSLSSPVNATISGGTANSLILNDDIPPPMLSISANQSSLNEGNSGATPFVFTVARSGDTSGASSAKYSISGSVDGADFVGGVLPSGTVSFAAGQTSQTITLNIAGDTTIESDELLSVTLSSPTGATISGGGATSTVLNDDTPPPVVSITADQASKAEGNAGTTPFTFTATRTGDLTGTSQVTYAVSGTTDGTDFVGGGLPGGVVAFAANQATATITINVQGDTTVEANEVLIVSLSSATGATLGSASTSSIVVNDDAGLSISADQGSKAEGNTGTTPFTFTVTRSGDLSGAASANYAVLGSSPANGADFVGGALPSGTVNFIAGQATAAITINVAGDTTVEPDESFTVQLSSPTGATIVGSTASSTILNDDAVPAPSLSIAANQASKAEGNTGTTPFTFTVTRTGDLSAASSAAYAVTGTGGNPASAADFGGSLPTGTVSFAAGAATAVVTVNVAGDTVVEPDEGFTVTLSSPVNATIGTPAASSTILNDDAVPVPSLSIAANQASKAEGNTGTTPFTFTVTRTGDLSAASSAAYAVTGTGGNPASAADFGGSLPTGTVNFAAGAATAVVTVNVAGDTVVEPDEGFTVTLSSPVNATIGTPAASSIILNDDAVPAPSLSIAANQASKAEGNTGTTPFTFTVTRTGDLSAASSAAYAVTGTGGNPASAADFGGSLPTGTVSFAAGAATAVVTVNVAGDTVVEPDEGFTVTLSSPVNATIGTPAASSTILNDDAVPVPSLSIAANQASKAEGNTGTTPFTFTVTRTGDLSAASSAAYAVTGTGGNPASAADFGGSLPTGTVNFAAGAATAVVTVNVAGDTVVEPDEGFTVTLSSPVNATIGTPAASSIILNDDAVPAPSLSIAANQASKAEGNTGTTPFTFTVTRTGDLSAASSAAYAVTGTGGNPASAADFGGSLPTGTVSFAAGAATAVVTVNVAGDTVLEPDEGFTVTLSSPVNATIGTPAASSTILNDDAVPVPSLSIAANQASKAEGNTGTTPFTFTVTRTGDLSVASSAAYAVTGTGGNPASAADFGGSLPTGTVSFAAGAATAVVTVNVAGDTVLEPDEGFTVTLSSPVNATIGTPAASSTILNDDAVPVPSLSIAANQASKAEGNTGTTPFTFTVTRTGDLSVASSAAYAVTGTGGNPASAADFGGSLPTGTVSFAAGAATAVVTVNVAGDTVVEPDEGFTVTLSSPVNATIGTPAASSTILNDDAVPVPSLSIAANQASKAEGNTGTTPFTFTVTRTGDLSAASSAAYAVTGTGGNPASAADFGGSLPTGTVSFAAGAATAVVTVNVAGDTVVEPDEGFTVTLSSPVNATIGTPAASSIILNDDAVPAPSLSIAANQASKAEGNTGTTPFTFTVTRTGDLSAASSAAYAVTGTGGNPASAADFGGSLPTGSVSFAAGAATAVVTVNVAGDTVVEPDEGFTVTLSSPVNATIGTPAASSTILNDDAVPVPSLSIAANQASKAEGNTGTTPFTFTVTRTGDLSVASSAAYAVTGTGGNPASAADFGGSLPTGTVSFAAGAATAVVTVNVAGDTVVEPDEGFTVTLSSPVNATIGTPAASSIILNDDAVPVPSLSIAANQASKAEGNTGTTPFTFTVTRTGDLSVASSAAYAVTGTGGNPASAADFGGSLPTGTVSFAAGAATAVVTVNVAGDTVVEPDEGFTVTLSSPVNATIGTPAASSTILNDDAVPVPSLSIAANQASKAEGNTGTTPFTFTVTRTGDLSVASSAAYAVTGTGGNPASAADFGGSLPTGTVSFAAGAATAVVTVNVAGDTVVEPDEGFTVTLSSPVNATIGTPAASSTILNDDAVPVPSLSIAANQASKAEGNTGTTPFTFTVTRTGDLSAASSAAYAVTGTGGNPASAADFGGSLPTGTVSFAAGAATAVVTVNVAGDTVVEPDEGFTVTLSSPVNATIGTPAASSIILNDDAVPAPSLSIAANQASKAEGNTGTTPFTFTVTRTGDLSAASSAAYAVTGTGGNPASAADFGGSLPTGSVSFAAGAATAVVTVNVAGDTVVEPDEGFTVTLSSPVNATIGTPAASSTILNDDAVPVPSLSIAANQASKAEGNTGTTPFTFTVTRTGDLSAASSAAYAVTGTGGNPASAADFGGSLPAGTVNFAAGAATAVVTVNVAGDTVVEPDESFTVTLSSPVNATIGTPASSSTILNDDTVVSLTTIGNAGPYNRSLPNAWQDAWLKPGITFIDHRQNVGNAGESWLAANFGTPLPGTYGGSDMFNGALGVAGRTAGSTPAVPQEIDGTEALRFGFAATVSQLDFTFSAWNAGDLARVETYGAGGVLLGSQTTASGTLDMGGLSGVVSAVVRVEQGSFNVGKLSFG